MNKEQYKPGVVFRYESKYFKVIKITGIDTMDVNEYLDINCVRKNFPHVVNNNISYPYSGDILVSLVTNLPED